MSLSDPHFKKSADGDRPTVDQGRRRFLVGSAGAVAGATMLQFFPSAYAEVGSAVFDQAFVRWKEAGALIPHSPNTMETRRDAIGQGVVTSSDRLFVRNNLPSPTPEVVGDPDRWAVRIEGVNNPDTLTVGDLKNMGIETVASVLQCSGNGRAFFPHGASGSQWSVGAAGCVVWTGVPLRDVVRELGGVREGMTYITSTGGEAIPDGVDPKSVMVERSVPLRALEHAMLAWGLNDEDLPITHGGPLRMVVPGFYGVNNVKYVKQVAFTDTETDARIQRSSYRVRDVGVGGNPSQPSMWEMSVKSWITTPLERGSQGRNFVYGVAFGGAQALDRVDVSADGGRTWQRARLLGPDLGQFAWRPFVAAVNLVSGDNRVVSRATDVMGNTQPEGRIDNERGYGHNGWSDHGVTLMV